jgi:hypothetical protein
LTGENQRAGKYCDDNIAAGKLFALYLVKALLKTKQE